MLDMYNDEGQAALPAEPNSRDIDRVKYIYFYPDSVKKVVSTIRTRYGRVTEFSSFQVPLARNGNKVSSSQLINVELWRRYYALKLKEY